MSNTSKQSPLGVNVLGSLMQNNGLVINPTAASYMGASKDNDSYTPGSVVNSTVLKWITYAIHQAYVDQSLSDETYTSLISIGSNSVGALGNSKPPTYIAEDPTGQWTAAGAPATTGYPIIDAPDVNGQSQTASWLPYDLTNPNKSITQWGYIRLHALQAWNEFNWNGTQVTSEKPEYKEFCGSMTSIYGAMVAANQTIFTVSNSETFLKGTYSNMDDLISAEITGVNLSSVSFGNDLINLGKALDFKMIETFGMPSNLLKTLGSNSAITQDLSFALLASGLSSSDITGIITGTKVDITREQEQQIYGAFLIIVGASLAEVLAPLQCNTVGLNSLADLLNLRKMFPLSAASMTVPLYNGTPGPTNSKTYYPIFDSGGLNPILTSSAVREYVGVQIPSGMTETCNTDTPLTPENYNSLPKGFGSYLYGIIPDDQAVAAGAFSYSMRQIKNIENIDFIRFAKVAQGIETTTDLPLVNGTDKPTNEELSSSAMVQLALGSGPNGSYTMSDFFGCMSGLPYPWELLQKRILELQTKTLYDLYKNIYLSLTAKPATAVDATITLEKTELGISYYDVSITDPGGGYTEAPNVTGAWAGTATAQIGTNENDVSSYGRVTKITIAAPESSVPPETVTLTIDPPTIVLDETEIQSYIEQANAEIALIQETKPETARYLIEYWNLMGSQLMREQRSRYNLNPPVSVPKDNFVNAYPAAISTFVDMFYSMSQDTRPHMAAQTLEAISDMASVGGQSVVGLMRQERNLARIQSLGLDLDNNIPDTIDEITAKVLTTNGTSGNAVDGITSPTGVEYTIPAWPTNVNPIGDYSLEDGFQERASTIPGDITPILTGAPNPVVNTVVPVGPVINVPEDEIVIIKPPAEFDPANLPYNLDPNYTSSTLMPSAPSVQDALDQVTVCNCDCWLK